MSLHKINKKIKLIELVEKLKAFERNEQAQSLIVANRKLDDANSLDRKTQAELSEVDSMGANFINGSESIFSFEQRTNYAYFLQQQRARIALEMDEANNVINDIKIKIDRLMKQDDVLSEKKASLRKDQGKIINEKYLLDNA